MGWRAPNEQIGGILVVAAHPDDETIGCGGLLGRISDRRIVHLTDGVPRDSALRPPAFHDDAEGYRAARAEELRCALALLGMNDDSIICFGAIDQEASHEMARLAEHLATVLERVKPSVIITHPYEGGHPDHDTAAFIVRAAAAIAMNRRGWAPTIWEMTSYHAQNGDFRTGIFLPDRSYMIPGAVVAIALSADEQRRKERMMQCFVTQNAVLAPFGCKEERFRRAPLYDFLRPPHSGELHYERLGWPLTGRRWRDLASAAARRLFGSA